MKNTFLLLVFISIIFTNNKVSAQCTEAQNYVSKIQQADSWSPTKRVSSGDKIQSWTQISAWYAYNCECNQSTYTVNGVTKTRTADQAEAIRNSMNAISQTIQSNYPNAEFKPVIRNSPCGYGTQAGVSGTSGGKINNKTATQIEIENRFRNYNNAMNLKEQGENIAKAYAQQVKSYGELNETNSPEALLQNFNNNMQAIADLQTQNKADNLDQVTNTLNSTINDLNSGNLEGAMFSALSLLDQGEAKREARRQAEIVKQNLIYQTQKNMTAFYWKAVDLNNQAITQYYEKAAYAYSKEEETYLLEHIENLECHKKYMETNFNYSSTAWTQNTCAVPVKRTYTVNNLIAKDIQYINAAKRKYALYEKTGEPIFQQGAIRFAGLAATENPKTEYYYLMGHFAGTNNPLVAYSSFLTAESKNAKYFAGEKLAEFAMAKTSLEVSLKNAIEENNQEVIKNIVGANLHRSVTIDGSSPIVYAIKIDQADVVYAFLNTELEGKPQSVIANKVQEVISMAAILDATKTIQKFVGLGFSIDFILDGKTPLDVAEEALAVKSFNKISELLGGQSKYNLENSEIVKLSEMNKAANLNDTIRVTQLYDRLSDAKSKNKALLTLLYTKIRKSFFALYKSNKEEVDNWIINNRTELMTAFFRDLTNRDIKDVYLYFEMGMIKLKSTSLDFTNRTLMAKVWTKNSIDETLRRVYEPTQSLDFSVVINSSLKKYIEGQKNELSLYELYINNGYNNEPNKTDRDNIIDFLQRKNLLTYLNSTEFEYVNIDKGGLYKSYYMIDLLEFAVLDRRDLNLVKSLLKNFDYDGRFNNQIWNLLRELNRPSFDIYPSHYSKVKINNTLSKEGITEVLITKELVSKLKVNTKTFDYILTETLKSANKDLVYKEYKQIIDLMISRDFQSKTSKESLKNAYKQYKSMGYENLKTDKKYWNAIIEGNYDKRY